MNQNSKEIQKKKMKVGKRKRKVLVNQNSKQLQKRKEKQAGKVRKITQKKECEGNRTANR